MISIYTENLNYFYNSDQQQSALDNFCRCRTCGGSGLDYCPRCLGTGEYRYIMGFHFMKMDADNNQDHKNDIQRNQKRCSVADFYEE